MTDISDETLDAVERAMDRFDACVVNDNWSWWVGHDKERYTDQCATREEALQIVRDKYDGAWITEALPPHTLSLSSFFDVDWFLEQADERAQEDYGDPEGDDPTFAPTPDQTADLEAMVRVAIDAWQAKHGLTFRGWLFAAMRNTEYIKGDDDADQ